MVENKPISRIEKKEYKTSELGVFEETASLKKVMMWGDPGVETVLGQLLPKKISCFQRSFEVIKARGELKNARSMLNEKRVEIFIVKDEWAKMIGDNNMKAEKSMGELKKDIRAKGEYFYEKYKDERLKEESEEAKKENREPEPIAGIEVLDCIDELLDADMEKYGENAAVIMNEQLSLKGYRCKNNENLPLSNIFYARDQSNLMGKTWIWSSMKYDIRKAEVDIYKEIVRHSSILENNGITEVEVKEVNEGNGLFEGGDGIINNGVAYIGIGGRTDWEGVKQAAKPIIESGLKVILVRDRVRSKKGQSEMDAMHLDTFWMPTDINQAVGCEDEMKRRVIFEVFLDDKGDMSVKGLGSHTKYMETRGVEMVPLTKTEQENYAPNFLNLGDNEIILSLKDGNNLSLELTKRGKKVYDADFQEVTKGYGGLHCATASLLRE